MSLKLCRRKPHGQEGERVFKSHPRPAGLLVQRATLQSESETTGDGGVGRTRAVWGQDTAEVGGIPRGSSFSETS